MCLSSSGTNTSSSVARFEPPSWTASQWPGYTQNAANLSAQGLPIYTGQTVAPLSQEAQVGEGMLTGNATQGSPLYNSGQSNLTKTLQGGMYDPYATAANPYIGINPALEQLVSGSNQRITDAFSRGTAAQTDRAAAMAHAFGGSGQQEAQALNARSLGDALAQNTSGILGQNYYNSANLAEQGLTRASGAYEQERQRQLQAAGLAPVYGQSDLQAIQAMMGAGDANQAWQQQLLNAGQQLFGQFAQAPWQLSDLLGSALSRASGQGGTTSTQIYGPATNPWQTALGLGAAGYGMFGGG